MNEQHPYRATILPVPEGAPRPLWSVMIPTYNCAKYLSETLTSVLAQDPGPEVMQIEVIDDHSTQDDPKAVVEEIGRGRVGYYQQPHNVGHIKNFQTCLERSRGKLIHLLHGDDCVRDGFYRKLEQGFKENPEVGAAFSRHILMDENSHWQNISQLESSQSGILDNWLEKIASIQRIQTPSIVVRREVYEKLGGFDSRLSWTEDWEMWVRISSKYQMWYEVEPLALYRMHSKSSTGRRTRTGENIQDVRRAVLLIKEHLPSESADRLGKIALEGFANHALNCASGFINNGDTSAATNQIREALLSSSSWEVFYRALKLRAKLLWQQTFQRQNIQESCFE